MDLACSAAPVQRRFFQQAAFSAAARSSSFSSSAFSVAAFPAAAFFSAAAFSAAVFPAAAFSSFFRFYDLEIVEFMLFTYFCIRTAQRDANITSVAKKEK